MKRRDFVGSVAATVAGGSGKAWGQQDQPLPPPAAAADERPALVRTPLVLMAPQADGFEGVWAVSRLSRGWLEWETDGLAGRAGVDAFGFVPQADGVLRARVSGLKKGSSGRVRAHTVAVDDQETVVTDWKAFRILNPDAETTHFAMWNDTHVHDDTIRELHARTPKTDFLLWNGDTCNDWTKPEWLVPTLLHPGGCDISAGRPLFINWGNHDVRGPHAFRMPSMIATPTGRPFHAFRSGPVAAICLHTGEDKPDDHPSFRGRVAFDVLRAEQTRWLSQTIELPAFANAPYRLVFCHIPLRWKDERLPDYAKGGFDRFSARSRDAWHNLLVKWKAQVVLSGHTHEHAWLPADAAFPYGQLIGGGPRKQHATISEGRADPSRCVIQVSDLSGAILHEVTLTPVT